ncbi:hypothetical protein BVI2075_1160006 [Burkholderia vietnamiensis]|nr:hypothetical protein BVI2075_1160006 [Burkholderia vietnamiensis]
MDMRSPEPVDVLCIPTVSADACGAAVCARAPARGAARHLTRRFAPESAVVMRYRADAHRSISQCCEWLRGWVVHIDLPIAAHP